MYMQGHCSDAGRGPHTCKVTVIDFLIDFYYYFQIRPLCQRALLGLYMFPVLFPIPVHLLLKVHYDTNGVSASTGLFGGAVNFCMC